MKISLKSVFGIKLSETDNPSSNEERLEYDKCVNFYYSNLINSIILFALTSDELEKLTAPAFNPISDLNHK